MIIPTATYRLQFRNGMTFDAAEALVPYWRDLGISHLYASPIFTAVTGSTHGYDITDQNEIDPTLGGRGGFERLSRTMRGFGMGILLDIVPNHMAASLENKWWRDVIQWGSESRFAGHFDIDWSRRLTLPVLGQVFEKVLEAGELSLIVDWEAGTLALACNDNRFPLNPRSWDPLLSGADHDEIRRLAELARYALPGDADQIRNAVLRLKGTGAAKDLNHHLAALSRNKDVISSIHERQPWVLGFWKGASSDLSYRRFFEITGLVGLAVEKERVFDDAHVLALELLSDKLIDGLRIDHIDGLADPEGYLRRLREKAGDEAYIVVEKILGPEEQLPADWPVAGTTGYEFIEAAADLLVDPKGLEQFSRIYEMGTGSASTSTLRRQAKQQIITRNFEGELEKLAGQFAALNRAPDKKSVREALVRLLVALPVYRTYGTTGALSGADRSVILTARNAAVEGDPSRPRRALDFVAEVLIRGNEDGDEGAAKARIRFQQLSGPVMAKGVEDTLFYRDHRFLALNEVGSEPDERDVSVERFHAAMAQRARHARHALNATATHDTKRGEDARARLYALSEMPESWADLVDHWRRLHRDHVTELANGPAPEPELEWKMYQALAGLWPETLPDDLPALDELRPRFIKYVEKVLREAEARTSWTDVNKAYENAVKTYASALLDPNNTNFLTEMSRALLPIRQAGWLNSLTQTIVKLTAPGVPDIYQGTEGEDFSLVDPDNRRPIDWNKLKNALMEDVERYLDPRFKQFMIKRLLRARRKHPGLFSSGDYRPLKLSGRGSRHLVAFTRASRDGDLIVLAPRLTLKLLSEQEELNTEAWRDAEIAWPEGASDRRWFEVLSGERCNATSPLVRLLFGSPYAVLIGISAEP